MSPLSSVQQGIVAQYEFAKLLILTSDGQLEPAVPVSDDDRRDFEVHVKGNFRANLAIQLKSAIFLRHQFQAYTLAVTFTVRKDRLVSDALFWYAIMCLDMANLGYRDPLFLVNSVEMHRHAGPRLVGDTWHFEFHANMSPESTDRWRLSQVTGKNLGQGCYKSSPNYRSKRRLTTQPSRSSVGSSISSGFAITDRAMTS